MDSDNEYSSSEIVICNAKRCINEGIIECDDCEEVFCENHIAEQDILCLCEICNATNTWRKNWQRKKDEEI